MNFLHRRKKPIDIVEILKSAIGIILIVLFVSVMLDANPSVNPHSNMFEKLIEPVATPTPDPLIVANAELTNENQYMRREISSRAKEFEESRSKRQRIINTINKNLGGKLANKGEYIYNASVANDIPAFLVVAIMMHEVAGGNAKNSTLYTHNNVGGFYSNGKFIYYKSIEQSISAMCERVKRYYIDEGRTTISEFGAKYCPVGAKNDPTGLNKHWIPGVKDNYIKLLNESGGIT